MEINKLIMVQNGPCPSTLRVKICPFNLYWPVTRSSGSVACNLAVINTGSTLREVYIYWQIHFINNIWARFTYENELTLILAMPRNCISEQIFVKSPILYSMPVLYVHGSPAGRPHSGTPVASNCFIEVKKDVLIYCFK